MDIARVGVVGAGQMGNGIAQVAAQAGYPVILLDVNGAALDKGLATIERNLGRMVEKGKLTAADADLARARIGRASETEALGEVDLVIEAATENVGLKFKIFEGLSKVARPGAILASNTSSISITAIAAHTDRPDRVAGMHFMNPVPVMQLVELIRGLATTDETFEAVRAAAVKMGKITVEGRDMPGFIVNRVLMPYLNEAVFALYEGIGTVEDIDTAMKLGTNVPMGPLTLADFIGLDTCLAILEVLQAGTGDTKYRPCPLLRKYVEAGWLGKKTGKGFYTYDAKSTPPGGLRPSSNGGAR
jgi:3-hydroxybutyryl-CoA dehydrogenase